MKEKTTASKSIQQLAEKILFQDKHEWQGRHWDGVDFKKLVQGDKAMFVKCHTAFQREGFKEPYIKTEELCAELLRLVDSEEKETTDPYYLWAKEYVSRLFQREWEKKIWINLNFQKLAQSDREMSWMCSSAFRREGCKEPEMAAMDFCKALEQMVICEQSKTHGGLDALAKKWILSAKKKEFKTTHFSNVNFEKLVQGDPAMFLMCCSAFRQQGYEEPEMKTMAFCEELQEMVQLEENKTSGALVDVSHLKKQFDNKYEGKVHSKLLGYIAWCYDEWETFNEKWQSPFVAVVQSSGYGKSRACKEIALSVDSKEWLCVFICCRKKHTPGYPIATEPAIRFFENLKDLPAEAAIAKTTRWIECLMYFRLQFRAVFFKVIMTKRVWIEQKAQATQQPEDIPQWIEETMTNLETWIMLNQGDEVFDSFVEKDITRRTDFKDDEAERRAFWLVCSDEKEYVERMYRYIDKLMDKKSKESVITSIQLLLKEPVNQGSKLLVIVDEARYLVDTMTKEKRSLFRLFRSSLRMACHGKGIFGVVLDTHSHVGDFIPSRKKDPLREPQQNLFHPFTAFTTIDLFKKSDFDANDACQRLSLGRPLWMDTLSSDDPVANLTSLINLAHLKLLGVPKDFNDDDKLSDAAQIACMAVLTGLNISPISSSATELVGSHMATCLAVNVEKEAVVVGYPVEPVLAQASKHFVLLQHGKGKLGDVLQPLLECLRYGVIDRGQSGELIAKILLLLGQFSQTPQDDSFTASTDKVFTNLFGLENFRQSSAVDFKVLEQYHFSFNCFVELEEKSSYWARSNPAEELAVFFNRGAAIQLPRGHRGADFLLPVRRCVNGLQRSYVYKYVLVQVKNYKDHLKPSQVDEFSDKLSSTFEESKWLNYNAGFSLLLNVGSTDSAANSSGRWIPNTKSREREEKKEKEEEREKTDASSVSSPSSPTVGKKRKVLLDSNNPPFECFLVDGLGPNSYPGIWASKDSSLSDALFSLRREPSVLDWTVSCAWLENTRIKELLELQPIKLRPKHEIYDEDF